MTRPDYSSAPDPDWARTVDTMYDEPVYDDEDPEIARHKAKWDAAVKTEGEYVGPARIDFRHLRTGVFRVVVVSSRGSTQREVLTRVQCEGPIERLTVGTQGTLWRVDGTLVFRPEEGR